MAKRNMASETNIKIPLSFIIYAVITFVASQFIFFLNSHELLASQFRIPEIWMSAHFLILGFAVMVAMGAMYQLVPVALLTPIWSEKLAIVQFFVTALGITFLATLLGFHPGLAVYGGAMTVIGVILFLFQMAKTLAGQKGSSPIAKFMKAALLCLLFTITCGLLLTWNLAFGSSLDHVALLLSHMTFGLAGWFTLLIMGFSYKLVPMFSLSHNYTNSWQTAAFHCYVIGLFLLIISYWSHTTVFRISGFFLLFLGFGYFVLDMKEIFDKRMKKRLDVPFHFATFAIINGFILHFLAFLIALFAGDSLTLWGWLIYLYLMVWIVFSILGYLYKIVPFLWWIYKYSERAGKEKVPVLKDLWNENVGKVIFILFVITTPGIIVSVALEHGALLYIFFGLQTVIATLYGGSILAVYRK